MNLHMGSQIFRDVQIPLLWGDRAIIQDKSGRLSVIDLSGENARPEIVADEPAPNIPYRPTVEGLIVLKDGKELYSYNSEEKQLTSISLGLPECQITSEQIRVGSSQFSGNVISGFGVGIVVTRRGIKMGAALPAGLAKLVV